MSKKKKTFIFTQRFWKSPYAYIKDNLTKLFKLPLFKMYTFNT